jgi:serine/threonine-protein kinase RIO1
MRVLLIDQFKERMALVRRAIASRMPDVEVTEYDAEQRGRPSDGFDWSLYDVVFLADDLGNHQSGLLWLKDFRTRPGFPAAVMIADTGAGTDATWASWSGADAVIGGSDLGSGRLVAALKAALAGHGGHADADRATERDNDEPTIIRSAKAIDPLAQLRPKYSYRGMRLIGQGGMSRVYLAERVEDGRTVVLKVLETSGAELEEVQRFVYEAQLISSIDSPYVVEIFEQAFTRKYGFIAMEFLSRGDLKQRIEHGIPYEVALLYLLQIAYALEAIHAVGIVHRDLKPANIMFRSDDSLALADFGVSKRMDLSSEFTAPGTLVGTLSYMSPEQVGARRVDSRSDLYSLGVVFFQMLTKRKPFVGKSPSKIIDQHLHGEIPRLPSQYDSVQPLLERLLAKDPADRFQSATELIGYLLPVCRATQPRQSASR